MIGLRRHSRDHVARDRAGDRQPDEDVGADERVGERPRIGRVDQEARLVRIHLARRARRR